MSPYSRNLDDFFKLVIVNHLTDNVETSDELSTDDELGERWPVVYNLQAWKKSKHQLVLKRTYECRSPLRTLSSVRMSKCPNSTPCSRRRPTICLEKPHRGASGLPFMKSITRSCVINPFNRFSSSYGDSESSSASFSTMGAAGA